MKEQVQAGVASDGHGIVIWVPDYAGGVPAIADLTASGAKRLTYGLISFDLAVTINTITTNRYTLAQALKLEGSKDFTLTTQYVYNRKTPTDAELTLGETAKGTEGAFVQILGYPNGHELVAGDVINAVIPARIASSTDVPPTANTELAKQMIPEIIGEILAEVELTA